eukprot:TRINITY_DN38368_c0_g1_i1.p1 TRINITY_DN38368_c0_g1~~TRINITY_DN38368_c0_g1_i1.p1  ORF type:complete len:126 (+),score=5.32 TRINITY_DN38368_c0_g1_i1:92-469(+)
MAVLLDALAQYWKNIETHRLSQYLLQRQLAIEASSKLHSTPDLELDEDYVPLAPDDAIDKKQKSIVINNSIEVQFHQYKGELLYTKLHFSNLEDIEVETLLDTGASTIMVLKNFLSLISRIYSPI